MKTMNTFEAFKKSVRDSLSKNKEDAKYLSMANRVFQSVTEFLANNQLCQNVPSIENFYTETGLPTSTNSVNRLTPEAILELCRSCDLPAQDQEDAAERIATILFSKNAKTFASWLDNTKMVPTSVTNSADTMALETYQVLGTGFMPAFDGELRDAMEMFGAGADRAVTDDRVNIAVALLKPQKELVGRLLPRVALDQPNYQMEIVQEELYDLAQTRRESQIDRNDPQRIRPAITLFRNPMPAITELKSMDVIPTNAAATGVILDATNPNFLKTSTSLPLWDLCTDKLRSGFDTTDWSDRIAEGGRVDTLLLSVSYTEGGATKTEMLPINVSATKSAAFIPSANTPRTTARVANLRTVQAITSKSTTIDGSLSALGAALINGVIRLDIQFTANMDTHDGTLNGNGSVNAVLVPEQGKTIADAVQAIFKSAQFKIEFFKSRLQYSEENLRKTTKAVRTAKRTVVVPVPSSTFYLFDFSLEQGRAPDQALTTIAKFMAVGNDARHLSIISNVVADVDAQLKAEAELNRVAPGALTYYDSAAFQSIAGTQCFPCIRNGKIVFDTTKVMRESELLGDVHARLTQSLQTVISEMHTASLYTMSLDGGETPVWKLVTSTTIRDLLFGIEPYKTLLREDEKRGNGGQNTDFSIMLPNRTRLDIVGTTYDQVKDKIIMFPIRDNEPLDVVSFARILDTGTFTTSYTPQNMTAVNNRVVTTAREVPLITNPTVAILTIEGIDAIIEQLKPENNDENTTIFPALP